MPAAAALLPKLIHEANNGRREDLMALAQMIAGGIQDSMAMGMQMSVVCSGDGDSMVSRAEDAGTVLGNLMPRGWRRCARPGRRARSRRLQPAAGDQRCRRWCWPAQFDPVTPPRYGEEIAKSLPNGRLFVLRGQGQACSAPAACRSCSAQFVEEGRRQGAGRQLPGQARLHAAVHQLQRLGTLSAHRTKGTPDMIVAG